MLNHPTLDKLQSLKLNGMATALLEQMNSSSVDALSFEERLGLLVDRETTYRDDRRMTSRLRRAKLRHNACFEDIDYRHPRGLDKALITSMATCQWLREHLNVLITGPSGVGKTWLACALAHQACREGYSALYLRLPRLLHDTALARGDGRYPKLLASLAKLDLLVIDDWGMAKLNPDNLRDLLEILEDRYGVRSTMITSQIPVDKWHDLIGEPTFADAILDRLVHNAYKLKLKGGSMRKNKRPLTQPDHPQA
ncbi:MAG: IS21-like element helper ATPase IstB [Gemmatimonadales bacterium]